MGLIVFFWFVLALSAMVLIFLGGPAGGYGKENIFFVSIILVIWFTALVIWIIEEGV
jgi:hypothetical protein